MAYSTIPSYGNVTISGSSTVPNGAVYTVGAVGSSGLNLGINGTSYSPTWVTTSNPVTVTQKATVELKGEDADLVINGVSLNKTLQGIQERLNILVPDPNLLEKYETLQEVYNQYKMLEALLMESKKK